MAEGGPLDSQRDTRWPDHTPPAGSVGGGGVKVQWNRYEEDSNASVTDDEEVYDPSYFDEPEAEGEGEGAEE